MSSEILESRPADPGQIITFYSYKGGTGRTMALANVACLLARAKTGKRRVLAIDWDLEAPGLHHYFTDRVLRAFEKSEGSELAYRRKPGLIDLFELLRSKAETLDYCEEPTTTALEDLRASVDLNDFIIATDVPNLDLMKAGSFDENYAKRVNTFPWEPLYGRAPWLIPFFADRVTARYSEVLIDSRTGITDTSGICTMLLPDKLVVVFTPNTQSLEGVIEMTERAATYRRKSAVRPLGVFPLASRIESNEPQQFARWRKGAHGYQPEFESLFRRVWSLPSCNLDRYFDEVQVQHVAAYAYGEKVAALIELDDNRTGLKRAYATFAEKLCELDDAWEDAPEKPRLDSDTEAAVNAAAIYAALTPDMQETARDIFLSLVRLVEGEPRTIGSHSELSPSMREAVEPFLRKGLLLESRGTISCSSERLPSMWEQLDEWVKTELAFLGWRSVLAPLAAGWERSQRNSTELLRSSLLAESEGFFLTHRRLLDQSEIAFIQASENERIRSEQSAMRRRGRLQIAVVLFTVVLALCIFAVWKVTRRDKLDKLRAAKINAAAVKISDADLIETRVLLAAESERVFASPDAELTLTESLSLLPKSATYYDPPVNVGQNTEWLITPASPTLPMLVAKSDQGVFIGPFGFRKLSRIATTVPVGPIKFDPVGQLAIAAGNAIYMDKGGRSVPVVRLGSPATALAFSGDGNYLSTGIRAGTVNVWSTRDFRIVATLRLPVPILSLAFSPDGKSVAIGTYQMGLQVWPFVSAGKASSEYPGSPVTRVSYSPDGKFIALVGHGSFVGRDRETGDAFKMRAGLRVFSVSDWKLVFESETAIGLSEFTPDSRYVADVEGLRGTAVQLWPVSGASPSSPGRILPAPSQPRAIAFSRNGANVVTASEDGSLVSWQLRSASLQGKLGPQLVSVVCDTVRRNLTREQWAQYLPDEPYRKTCPTLP